MPRVLGALGLLFALATLCLAALLVPCRRLDAKLARGKSPSVALLKGKNKRR